MLSDHAFWLVWSTGHSAGSALDEDASWDIGHCASREEEGSDGVWCIGHPAGGLAAFWDAEGKDVDWPMDVRW